MCVFASDLLSQKKKKELITTICGLHPMQFHTWIQQIS